MRLWEQISAHMERHANKPAFGESGLTYSDLLKLGNRRSRRKKFRICSGRTRYEAALEILRCIAEGDVAVPISEEYGKRNVERIKREIAEAKETTDSLAFVMFTSGTTGASKGVMLTEENICENLDRIERYFNIEECKKICIARPLAHIAVIVGELLYALRVGLDINFYEEAFMPKRLISFCAENDIDVLCGTPTMYRALARADKEKKFPVKTAAISGEILTEQAAREIAAAFPHTDFYNVYGLTEHGPRVSALLPQEFDSRPNSVGKPLCGVETDIKDGELIIRSPCVMKGYYADDAQTNQKKKNGWLYTGDRAHFDGDGYLYIDGRKDGMLIRGGINVYPEEIEAAACSYSGVNDCSVCGKESAYGTVICLQYEGDAEPQEVRKFLLKELNPNLVPNTIERVPALPRTASGKKVRS